MSSNGILSFIVIANSSSCSSVFVIAGCYLLGWLFSTLYLTSPAGGRPGPTVSVDVSYMKERKVDGGASAGNAGGLNEPLGGFIFVCNNDTMREDLERHLFGLPQRYQDSVKAIQTGLPLFLYNYSTRSMHGVFEATSDGGFNIEPEAWEIKEARRNGRPVSRFPAQVRVRLREERPALEESTFRSTVNYYDGFKFRLELTVPEVLIE